MLTFLYSGWPVDDTQVTPESTTFLARHPLTDMPVSARKHSNAMLHSRTSAAGSAIYEEY